MRNPHRNELRRFVKVHLGSNKRLSQICDVSEQAAGKWMLESPRNILKHLPEIMHETGITADFLVEVVKMTEQQMKNEPTIQGDLD